MEVVDELDLGLMLVNEAPDGPCFRLRKWLRAPVAFTTSVGAFIDHILTYCLSGILSKADLTAILIEIEIIDDADLGQHTYAPVDAVVAIEVDTRVFISAVELLLLRVNSVWAHILSLLQCLLYWVFIELIFDQSYAIGVDHGQYVVHILDKQVLEGGIPPHYSLMDKLQG